MVIVIFWIKFTVKSIIKLYPANQLLLHSMSKKNKQSKILKIESFDQVDIFTQVNLIKGYRYIGKLTDIVDKYYPDDVPPEFEIKDGIIFKKLNESLLEFRVNATSIWAKSDSTDLSEILKNFNEEVDKVSEVIGVDKYSRVGIRVRLLKKLSSLEYEQLSQTNITNGKLNNVDIQIDLKDQIFALFGYAFVLNSNDERGIVFDIDAYKEGNFTQGNYKDEISKVSSFYKENQPLLLAIKKILEQHE